MIGKHICQYLNSWITKNSSVKDTTLISQHGDISHLYENILKKYIRYIYFRIEVVDNNLYMFP